MESIGEKLKITRESFHLSIKDVVKETNISPMYIEALEEEDFEKFPSETYLIGFLRSYTEFLRLNPEEYVQAYRGYKIGESATPIEELTKPTKPSLSMMLSGMSSKSKNIAFIAGVAISALLVIIVIRHFTSSDINTSNGKSVTNIKDKYARENKNNKIENITNLQLYNNRSIVVASRNEAVQFLVDNKEVVFILSEVKDKSIVLKFLPGNQLETIEMEKMKTVKIPGCPRDISFSLKGLTENKAKILVMLGKKLETDDKKKETITSDSTDNTRVVAQNNKNLKIVFEAEFKQKSFIELYIDGNKKRTGFMPKGSKERWEAAEYMQIKIGNAGGINVKINGKDYSFGKSGQVANKIITWKKDVKNPNIYKIVVKDW